MVEIILEFTKILGDSPNYNEVEVKFSKRDENVTIVCFRCKYIISHTGKCNLNNFCKYIFSNLFSHYVTIRQ